MRHITTLNTQWIDTISTSVLFFFVFYLFLFYLQKQQLPITWITTICYGGPEGEVLFMSHFFCQIVTIAQKSSVIYFSLSFEFVRLMVRLRWFIQEIIPKVLRGHKSFEWLVYKLPLKFITFWLLLQLVKYLVNFFSLSHWCKLHHRKIFSISFVS